jgi:hypothetical protein
MQIAGASLTILGGVAYGKARQAIEEEASGVGGWGMDGGEMVPIEMAHCYRLSYDLIIFMD